MNKLFFCFVVSLGLSSTIYGQALPTPKTPAQMPKATAISYINNYQNTINNFFAYGYLLDIAKAKSISPTAVRIYNGRMNNSQTVLMVPLNSTYKVNTGGTNYMQSDASLCPKVCDIAGTSEASQVPGGQVSSMVNSCIDCREYESANAVVVHTPTLTNLQNAGFTRVRIYNGMDGSGKRYVVYVPIDERGQEVATDNMFVGDNTCVLTNCKYP